MLPLTPRDELSPAVFSAPAILAVFAVSCALLSSVLLAGCGRCMVGSRCDGITQEQVDRVINQSNALPGVRHGLCEVLSYSQTEAFGGGCTIEWR